MNGLVAACEPAFNLLRLLDEEKGNVTCLPTTVLQMCMFPFIAQLKILVAAVGYCPERMILFILFFLFPYF